MTRIEFIAQREDNGNHTTTEPVIRRTASLDGRRRNALTCEDSTPQGREHAPHPLRAVPGVGDTHPQILN